VRRNTKSAMSKPISYAEAAVLVERYAENTEGSARSALHVLAAGLRWKAQHDSHQEDPARIADAYAQTFPMHKAIFRELAALLRQDR